MGAPLIVLEFNELTPRLVAEYIARGLLPNFERLRDQSQVFVTDAQEQAPHLEPWIQWITVHSGMPREVHGISHLGDGSQLGFSSVWDIASRAGLSNWICGSMNAAYESHFKGSLLPDPWSSQVAPNRSELEPYFEFVRASVQEHTRARSPMTLKANLRFLSFMVRNGLRAGTLLRAVRQVVAERFAPVRWKRAVILDSLQFDLFRHRYRRERPAFSTFFLNSTAHFQHMYWRNMEPQLFAVKPTEADQRAHADAVLFGYQQMDRLVGEFLALDPEATIVFASALGQQPCLKYEAIGGRTFYRLLDPARFLHSAGIAAGTCDVEPVMSHQFHLRFRTPAAAQAGAERLGKVTIEGQPGIQIVSVQGTDVLAGCALRTERPPDARIEFDGRIERLSDHFYHVDLKKSGMHHPHGLFWIRRRGVPSKVHPDPVPLTDVAPTLLGLLGLAAPHMPGRDLCRDPAPSSQERNAA